MRTTISSQFPTHPAQRVTLLLSACDHAHRRPLMSQLLQRARRARLAGATVFEAHQGYGASGRVHRTHLLSDDRPVTVVIIDRPGRIDGFLHEVADLLDDVLVAVDDIDVVEL